MLRVIASTYVRPAGLALLHVKVCVLKEPRDCCPGVADVVDFTEESWTRVNVCACAVRFALRAAVRAHLHMQLATCALGFARGHVDAHSNIFIIKAKTNRPSCQGVSSRGQLFRRADLTISAEMWGSLS